jgi:8-oxo-dGTP pyrophosphatase MutT (NUDIX family)
MSHIQIFSQHIQQQLALPLPGECEQMRMAPYNRLSRQVAQKVNPKPKLSAVLILVYEGETELETLLMLRNSYNGTHSAQVSFPGGKKEENDSSLEFTALRETHEEVGITPQTVEVLGKLSELYVPPSGFLIHPYVAICKETPQFIPNPHEVKELIRMPLRFLFESDRCKSGKIPVGISKIKLKVPYYDVHGHIVWGATAMILSELKTIIGSKRYLKS